MRADRVNLIEQYIIKNQTATLDDLCDAFSVSLNTIRRDLGELVKRGRVKKVYGGVTVAERETPVPSSARNVFNMDGKVRIGELAAQLIADNDSIFVDSGSTIPNVIRHIAKKSGVTIISHSLAALREASKYYSINLMSLGGVYNFDTDSFVGASVIEAVNSINIKLALMAATGISIENGISNTTYYEAEIKRAVIRRAKKVILMVDGTKFDKDAPLPFCRLEDLEAVVTDRCPPQHYVRLLEAEGVKLLFPGQC